MADLLTELTDFLAAAAGLTVGVTLFRGAFPAGGTATVSAILPTGGLARGESPLRTATYQVLTRGETLGACLAQADALYAATLDARKQVATHAALTTRMAQRIEPLQPPASLGLDAESRWRTSFNFLVTATE